MKWKRTRFIRSTRRRRINKYRKSAKRFSRRVKRFKRSRKVLPQRKRLLGLYKPISLKKELKYVIYKRDTLAINQFTVPQTINSWSVLFAINGSDTQATPRAFVGNILQGAGANQRIGDEIVFKYIEITFALRATTVAPGTNIYTQDFIRLALIKPRKDDMSLADYPRYEDTVTTNAQFGMPADPKYWDIKMDKIIPVDTGATMVGPGIRTKNRWFRFIIPYRMNYRFGRPGTSAPESVVQVDDNEDLNLIAQIRYSPNAWQFSDISAIVYYIDP